MPANDSLMPWNKSHIKLWQGYYVLTNWFRLVLKLYLHKYYGRDLLSIYGILSRMDKGQLIKIINEWPPNDRFLRKKYPKH